MTKAVQKITLSPSRDIPFDKLVLSQSNVRRIKAGVSVEELAEDIARRGLLQSLSVRPGVGADGTETGTFESQGRTFCGLFLGDHSKTAIHTAFSTATVVGVMCNVFGTATPPRHLPSFTWGVDAPQTHDVDRALATASKAMARRNQALSPADEARIRKAFEDVQRA